MVDRLAQEPWQRWREPVAVVLLVVAGVRLIAGIVAVPVLAVDDAYGSFATAAMFEAGRTFDVVLLLVAAAVAASCLLPPVTSHARLLGTLALVLTAASVLVALGFGLMGLTSSSSGRGVELAYLLLGLVAPVVVVVLLFALLRLAGREPSPAPSPQVDVPLPAAAPIAPSHPPELPAAWQSDQATGRVWTTAGDAARGVPGGGWPAEGNAGWQPIPGPIDGPGADPRRPLDPAP